jgi:hypothetical protein
VYANPKQIAILSDTTKDVTCIGGRGSGKSWLVQASMAQRWVSMPQAKFFMAAPTFKQMLKMTLSGLESHLNGYGWVEGRDYVKWKTPPKHFEKPISKPEDYSCVISYRNGSHTLCMSMDSPDSNRGGSFAGGDADEVQNMKKHHFDAILNPSLRGYRPYFPTHPILDVVRKFGSMPRKAFAFYLFDYKLKAKHESNLFAWHEMTAYDNLEFWGIEGIERLKRTMSQREFDIEVMNKLILKAKTPFYPNFNSDRHTTLLAYDYVYNSEGWIVKGLKALERDRPVAISFDFGGWFNCCTMWQYDAHRHRELCLIECWKAGHGTLQDVVSMSVQWLESQGHKSKLIKVYGDPRGHDPQPDSPSMFEKIESYFQQLKYHPEIKVKKGSQAFAHVIKYEVVNEMYAATNPQLPTILISTECECLIETSETTERKSDGTKDKDTEKDREFPQEKSTHLTDTKDYYLMRWHARGDDDDSGSSAGTI